ncbi:energy transducer TonB [Sphingomonas longa]
MKFGAVINGARVRRITACTALLFCAPEVAAQVGARFANDSIWVFPEDFPAEAVAIAEDGPANVILSVDVGGTVTACRVDPPTGALALDRTACDAARRRGRILPARDTAGTAVAADYKTMIWWGFWQDEETIDAQRARYQTFNLQVEGDDRPIDCGITRDNIGRQRSIRHCQRLSGLLPRARTISGIKGRMTLSAIKVVGAGDGEAAIAPAGDEIILREIRTTYTVAPDGGVSGCKTVISGQLTDEALDPGDPCPARRAKGLKTRQETMALRLVATPPFRLPIQEWRDDIVFISLGAKARSECRRVAGIDDGPPQCGEIAKIVERIRARSGFTGRIESHHRRAASFGSTAPPDLVLSPGEAVYAEATEHFTIDPQGEVKDCTTTFIWWTDASRGHRACHSMPFYERGKEGDAGGILHGMTSDIYSFRESTAE